MGLSPSNTYFDMIETNTARNAMRHFESENKDNIGYDWEGNPKSSYQITGWDIVKVDGISVKRTWSDKKKKDVYVDCNGNILA